MHSIGYTGNLRDRYENGSYIIMKDEPIYPLMDHSDCDGKLIVEEMKQILPQLETIINNWSDNDIYKRHDKQTGLELIKGMKFAIERNESLEFL